MDDQLDRQQNVEQKEVRCRRNRIYGRRGIDVAKKVKIEEKRIKRRRKKNGYSGVRDLSFFFSKKDIVKRRKGMAVLSITRKTRGVFWNKNPRLDRNFETSKPKLNKSS